VTIREVMAGEIRFESYKKGGLDLARLYL